MSVRLLVILQALSVIFNESAFAERQWTGGGYSEDFIPNVTCAHLNRHSTLSLHPMDRIKPGIAKDAIRTATQAERQFMIQKKMFECQPLAIYAADRVVEANKASMTPEQYAKVQELLFNPDRIFSAIFALPFGMRKYFGQLNGLLVTQDKTQYNPADNSYPWIWPKHSLDDVNAALKVGFGGLSTTPALDADPNVDKEIRGYLTAYPQTLSGRGGSPESQVVIPDAVFYGPGGSNPEQNELLTKLGALRRELNENLLCLVKNGLPLNGACPGKRTLGEVRVEQRQARIDSAKIGVPLMSPTVGKIHPAILSNFPELCRSVQRTDNAHREWLRVTRLNTHDAFTASWMSMFGQSIGAAERAMNKTLEFDNDIVIQGGKLRSCALALARNTPKEIANCPYFDFTRTYADGSKAIATGPDASGNCPLGPIE